MGPAECPRCHGVVALHEGRPSVTRAGSVQLWHHECWAVRGEPVFADASPIASARRNRAPSITAALGRMRHKRWVGAGVACCALVGVGFGHWAEGAPRFASNVALANVDMLTAELDGSAERTAREVTPPRRVHVETRLEARHPIPSVDSAPLDSLFTSLHGWFHPVASAPELMPSQSSRRFGAERFGTERPECGEGHCGVDLDGPRGRPIVAVASGTVVRVERSELGLDGRSGRYVRIEHGDGTLTAYMHLDDVDDELRVGDHVDGGQYLGTLGATAIFSAAPHLHFSLEVPLRPGQHGDNLETRYVDPAPFLVRAMIVSMPDRRRPIRPTS